MQGIDLVLQRLEGVVALFLGARAGVAVGIRDLPLRRRFAVLVEAGRHERSQYLIDTVDGGAAVDVARHLGDDLCGNRRGGRDRLRRFDLGVAHLEALGQHPLQVDKHAVKHREEGRVVEIVVVDIPALVGQHHVARQQVLTGVVLGNDARQQVALGRDHLAVFVGILIEQGGVGLLYQATDLLIQAATLLAGDIAVVAILNIGPRQLLVGASHQLVFYCGLDLADVYLRSRLHLLSDHLCDGSAIVGIINARRSGGTQNRFLNTL